MKKETAGYTEMFLMYGVIAAHTHMPDFEP